MISLISLIVTVASIFLSKVIFRKWFNPLSFYAIIWGTMVFAYGFRLLPLVDISNEAWIAIILSYIAFIFGVLIIYTARDIYHNSEPPSATKNNFYILYNDGKLLKTIIWIFAVIGLFAALQHWYELLSRYGSFTEIFIHSLRVYRERIDGVESGEIPYLWLFSYIAIFLSGIYTAYKGKIEIVTVLSILGIVLKEMARFTRNGILLGMLEFIIAFILFRYMLSAQKGRRTQSKRKLVLGSIFLILLFVVSASFIKVARNTYDDYKGASSSLSQYKGGAFISPSIYFYLTSQIAVFSRYLEVGNEKLLFAQNTLFPVYSLLSKTGVVKRPSDHNVGYFVPTWSNTATYLRDLHADYGFAGILFGPFLLGLLVTFYWYKVFYEHDLISFVILSFLLIIVGMSFFVILIKSINWWFSFISVIVIFKYFKKNYSFQLNSEQTTSIN